jgi:DNA modification methylase
MSAVPSWPEVTFLDGRVRLIQADCREILPTLGKVDAVVTDPPYGVGLGKHGGAKDGRRDHVLVKRGYDGYDDTEENLVGIVVPAVKVALSLADRGLVFCAGSNAWHFPRADLIGGVYLPAAQGRNKWGFTSFWPCLFYGRAPDLNLGAKATAYRSTAVAEKSDHPCPKPIEWMEWALSIASRPADTILDPFMGSGTTGIAALKLGRRFIGIEIEPKYFDIACRRIEEATRQPDLFIERAPEPKQEALL